MPDDADPEVENQWDAALYESDHSFVYEYGEDVVELLSPRPDERILDIGCGTGHLTAAIHDHGASVLGIDSSEEMIRDARNLHPDCSFSCDDIRSFETTEQFDAVFSNAAFHWIPREDHDQVLETILSLLSPDGRFVVEFGGTGNVQTITDAVISEMESHGHTVTHPWYFPSIGEYATRMEAAGFEVAEALLFDRPTPLENGEDGLRAWLDMFGDSFFAAVSQETRDEIIHDVETTLRPTLFHDGTWVADYRRIRFRAVPDQMDSLHRA